MASARRMRAAKGPRTPEVQRAKDVMDELRAERGRLSRIAEELGLTAQAVHQWSVVPLNRLMDVSRITGISARRLRPDFHLLPRTVARS